MDGQHLQPNPLTAPAIPGSSRNNKGTMSSELVRLCDASEVEPDVPVRAEVDGTAYAVFTVDGEYFVTQDLCTHGPGNLSEGFVEGGEIECPFHQGKFDIRTGRPTHAPCTVALRTWAVTLRDGAVMIDPAAGSAHG